MAYRLIAFRNYSTPNFVHLKMYVILVTISLTIAATMKNSDTY